MQFLSEATLVCGAAWAPSFPVHLVLPIATYTVCIFVPYNTYTPHVTEEKESRH